MDMQHCFVYSFIYNYIMLGKEKDRKKMEFNYIYKIEVVFHLFFTLKKRNN